MLEELLAAGKTEIEYDAWLIRIGNGDQFCSGFVEVNPNSKIPALWTCPRLSRPAFSKRGSILLYLSEKFDACLPKDPNGHTQALNWLFWQMGSVPFLGGGFGHFYVYAPRLIQYAIDRFSMEVKRQLDMLDRYLGENHVYGWRRIFDCRYG